MERRSFAVLTVATAVAAALVTGLLLRSCADDCGACKGSSVTITWDAGVLDEADFVQVCARDCQEMEPYPDASKSGRVVADEVFNTGDYLDVSLTLQSGTESVSLFSPHLERPRDRCGCRKLRFHVNEAGDALVRE